MPSNSTALLSELSIFFVKTAGCTQVSKDEAMDAIRHVLVDVPSASVQQLFDIFVHHGLLEPVSDQYYRITNDTRAMKGVCVPFTSCYSASCTPQNYKFCYSPSCPNQPQPAGPMRLWDPGRNTDVQDWMASLPQSLLISLGVREQKRQAAIAELLASEQQYCRDLDILRHVYADALLASPTAIEQHRRQRFHDIVFGNYDVIAQIHEKGCNDLLNLRQTHFLFVDRIGATVLRHVSRLVEPYVMYAANHAKASYVVTIEIKRSPQFQMFLDTQDNQACTRRLGLRHYLTMPTQRIGKYRLLVEAIYKRTADDGDQLALSTALAILSDLLLQMNDAARRAETETRFLQIATLVVIPPHIPMTMKDILPDRANLIHEGPLHLARSLRSITLSPCHVFVFSHLILVTRVTASEELVLAGRPIPVSMLRVDSSPPPLVGRLVHSGYFTPSFPHSRRNTISGMPERSHTDSQPTRRHSSLVSTSGSITGLYLRKRLSRLRISLRRHAQTAPDDLASTEMPKASEIVPRSTHRPTAETQPADTSVQHTRRLLKISHMAYPDCEYRLAFASAQERDKWRECIQQVMPSHPDPFKLHLVCEFLASGLRQPIRIDGKVKYPTGCGRIWCTLPFVSEGRDMLALGTQHGLWIGRRDMAQHYSWALGDHECQQLGVFDNRILLVSARRRRRALYAYDIHTLHSPLALSWSLRRSGVVAFAQGTLGGIPVLCCLTKRRRRGCAVTIFAYHPSKDSDPTCWLRKIKEYPLCNKDAIQVHVRHNCVFVLSAAHGVEFIHGTYLTSQLGVFKPLALAIPHHIEGSFIDYVPLFEEGAGYLCTANTAWSTGKGHSVKLSARIDFEAEVERVALVYPYLIAFSPNVVEIRHVEKATLVQTIQGNDIRCVHLSRDDDNTPAMIHVSILQPDDGIVCVYTLSLRSPYYKPA